MALVVLITLGFVLIAYVLYTLIDVLWLQKARIRRRIEGVAGGAAEPVREAPQVTVPEGEPLPTVARMLSSQGFADRLLLMLQRAGVKLRPSEFIGIAAGAALVLALAAAAVFRSAWAELPAILVGGGGPFLYTKALQSRRLTTFNRQLPDALALIGSAIRSGYSFPRAMQMVADEMPPPIAEEFQRVLNEINVGLPAETALQHMVARVRSYDLELIVTAVVVQQQIGGNLAEIIQNIASTIRDRVRVEGDLAVLTAEGRISGVVLVLLPFAIAGVIWILNPNYLRSLFAEPLGIKLIIGGICLQVIGALVIKRMLVMDY